MNYTKERYGFDLLSIAMIFLSLILNIFDITRPISFLILILSFYRAFSKKIYKRREEYNIFYTYVNKFLNKFNKSIPSNIPNIHLNSFSNIFNIYKNWFIEKKNYKITKCPNCNQKLRLPRGKGNIIVTCRRCSTKFDLRT